VSNSEVQRLWNEAAKICGGKDEVSIMLESSSDE